MRYDYLEKAKTPRIHELLNNSLVSSKLNPAFPSITFPSHCSQTTGTKVKEHGIPFNSFYDTKTGTLLNYPSDSALLTAEPIWQTAKRGGKRSAVLNWPLSFNQVGPYQSDYFNEAYEKELNDETRIDRALNLWQKDEDSGKELQLIMAYIVGPDSVAHKLGPHHEKVIATVEEVDRLVGKIQDKIKSLAEKHKDTHYYLFLTTDHGMTEVKTAVNFSLLNGLGENTKVRIVPGGPIGHIFLDGLPANERLVTINKLKRRYTQFNFVKIFTKNEMPKDWGYDHPTRVGDLVVILDPGYAFVGNSSKVTAPIAETNGPLGMHGYLPEVSPEMYGMMILWRWPQISSRIEITSPVDSLNLHATVAKLLRINPSKATRGIPLKELKHFSN